MATDRALLESCNAGETGAVLRLYGWARPTLTLGYAQKPDREIDRERCRNRGIPVVRRPTGGRAILHCHELTYALVVPIPHPQFPSDLMGAYDAVSQTLIASLRGLGLEKAQSVRPTESSSLSKPKAKRSGGRLARVRYYESRFPGSPSGSPPEAEGNGMEGSPRFPSCFASADHREIVIEGKKLVGSAQRRLSGAFLQQGTLLIDLDREGITDVLRFDSPSTRDAHRVRLRDRTIALSEALHRSVEFLEVADAILRGFQIFFPGNWMKGELTSAEKGRRDAFLSTGTLVEL